MHDVSEPVRLQAGEKGSNALSPLTKLARPVHTQASEFSFLVQI
jgi:hypothetical protein